MSKPKRREMWGRLCEVKNVPFEVRKSKRAHSLVQFIRNLHLIPPCPCAVVMRQVDGVWYRITVERADYEKTQ